MPCNNARRTVPESRPRAAGVAGILAACAFTTAIADGPGPAAGHDYPTTARVEFVQECMFRHGGTAAYLYKCSCVIDHIAAEMVYEDFVEASTYARNSTLGGDAGAVFRDPKRGKDLTRLLRDVQGRAESECGVAAAGG